MKFLLSILNLFLKKSTPVKNTPKKSVKKTVTKVSKTLLKNTVDKKVSKYFWESEFKCKCGKCQLIPGMSPVLIERLDKMREEYGQPIIVTSGFRCKDHNKRVGGSPRSQHLYGRAADITGEDLDRLYELAERYFDSIGDGRENGLFIHVDTRKGKRRWMY